MKTFIAKTETAARNWVLIDLKGKVLGRAATRIADILRGKHKPVYTPHADAGDFVVAINAAHIKFTGNKLIDKKYYKHSGYIGGLKTFSAGELLERHPEEVITLAVKGMLPHTALGRKILKKLKVYAGETHPHQSQQPVVYPL